MTQSPQSSTEASQDSSNPKEPGCRSMEEHQRPAEDVVPPISREQMLSVLDRFGAYQKRLLLLSILPVFFGGYTSLSVIIAMDSPQHRCRVPGLVNDTYSIQSEAHRRLVNLSIPMTSSDGDVSYSKCDVYKDRDVINRSPDDDTETCDSWVYDNTDFDRTIVTEFNLVCEDKGFRAKVNMMYMLGLLVGSSLNGILCDRLGRKKVFMVCVLLNIVVVMAMAFPVLPSMLLVYRFLAGVFFIAYYLAFYVLCLEFMGTSHRTLAGALIKVPGPFGSLLNVSFSYIIMDWRWLQILNGAPFIVLISYWWLIDESPRWLLSKGRVQEAQNIIYKIMKVNKMTLPADLTFSTQTIAVTALQQSKTLSEQISTGTHECTKSDSSRDPLANEDNKEDPFAKKDNQGDPFGKGDKQEGPIAKSDHQGDSFGKADKKDDQIAKGGNEEHPFAGGDNQEGTIAKKDNREDPFTRVDNQRHPIAKGDNQGLIDKGVNQGDMFAKGDNQRNLISKQHNQGALIAKGDNRGDPFAKGENQEDLIAKGNNQDLFTKGGNREDALIEENSQVKLEMNTVTKTTDGVEEKEKSKTNVEEHLSIESPLKLFKYPNLIARTGIIFFNWSAVSMTYYGLSLNVSNLEGSARLNFIFSTLVEVVGFLIPWPLFDRLGRKRTHCTVMLLSGIFCLVSILPLMLSSMDLHWLTIVLMMLGKMCITSSFSTVYLMSGELFPTVIRNLGVGSSSAVSRVATAVSPYIADLSLYIEGRMGQALPLIIFGSLALAAGLMALCLPETLNRKLPDTILEAATFTQKKQTRETMHMTLTVSDDEIRH